MDIAALIASGISAIAAIVVAVIQSRASRRQKKADERAKRRERESRLSMGLMSATLDLAYVTSLAVTGGHTNGNVEAAQKKAKAAQEAYEDFLIEETARAVAKI